MPMYLTGFGHNFLARLIHEHIESQSDPEDPGDVPYFTGIKKFQLLWDRVFIPRDEYCPQQIFR
jgi:hypothetical protein